MSQCHYPMTLGELQTDGPFANFGDYFIHNLIESTAVIYQISGHSCIGSKSPKVRDCPSINVIWLWISPIDAVHCDTVMPLSSQESTYLAFNMKIVPLNSQDHPHCLNTRLCVLLGSLMRI